MQSWGSLECVYQLTFEPPSTLLATRPFEVTLPARRAADIPEKDEETRGGFSELKNVGSCKPSLHPGDGPLQPGERRRDPREDPHRGDLGAARRPRQPGGAEEGSDGEGHQSGDSCQIPGPEHRVPPAAQRALRDRGAAGTAATEL